MIETKMRAGRTFYSPGATCATLRPAAPSTPGSRRDVPRSRFFGPVPVTLLFIYTLHASYVIGGGISRRSESSIPSESLPESSDA